MPGCSIERETEGDRTVMHVAGIFDRTSALDLRARVEREPARELTLDFSLVREFADLGVATLARELAGADRRLHLRGLRRHQLRMFRYFGLDVDALSAAALR